ncbi:hypothetical protein DFJ67_3511 [Asanoa ferruginea]|uniref:Uncharacterized protein n=1 Tax=Asanoa ferruginea TaxID=53367 RepID=A0A3D9ZV03_9ACTN|nr:hypothetical protein DFJ67_3511 [Asanoa ferruginea]
MLVDGIAETISILGAPEPAFKTGHWSTMHRGIACLGWVIGGWTRWNLLTTMGG